MLPFYRWLFVTIIYFFEFVGGMNSLRKQLDSLVLNVNLSNVPKQNPHTLSHQLDKIITYWQNFFEKYDFTCDFVHKISIEGSLHVLQPKAM